MSPQQPNKNPFGIPKFTCTKSLPGSFSEGIFVYHNNTPFLVGKVMDKSGGGFYIKIIRNPQEADDDQVKVLCDNMRDWYYQCFVKPEQEYKAAMARIDELLQKGSSNLSDEDLAEVARLQELAEEYDKRMNPLEPPATREGKLERARIERRLKS